MAIQGFQKVKARIMWAASVVTTAISTQVTFLPVLSTRNPRTGDAGAEMMYTMLAGMEGKENKKLMGIRLPLSVTSAGLFHIWKGTAVQKRNHIVWVTCSQLWLQQERSWTSQWRKPWSREDRGSECLCVTDLIKDLQQQRIVQLHWYVWYNKSYVEWAAFLNWL